jgi:hypothetical protein
VSFLAGSLTAAVGTAATAAAIGSLLAALTAVTATGSLLTATIAAIGSLLAAFSTVAATGATGEAFFSANFGSTAAVVAGLLSAVVIPFDSAAGLVADADATAGADPAAGVPLADVSFGSTEPVGFLAEDVTEPGFVLSVFVELDDGLRDSGSSSCSAHCFPSQLAFSSALSSFFFLGDGMALTTTRLMQQATSKNYHTCKFY